MDATRTERRPSAPFPLRMPDDVKEAAMVAKEKEQRSLNWVLVDRLRKAFKITKK